MELSIIILNYNTRDLTLSCIDSICTQYSQELDNGKFEIILVDNASKDQSLEAFRKLKINNLTLIESKENLGFSKGCNLGARHASGKFLFFLNSDTEIKDQGLKGMIKYFDDKKGLGILGGKLKNDNGTNQLSSGKFYSLFNLFLMLTADHFLYQRFTRKSPNTISKVDWVSGASLMIKRNTFRQLGGFDKDMFMYFEDMDLCFRAKQKGLSTYFYPDIMLFHKEGRSSGRTFAVVNIYKSTLIFYKKHKSGFEFRTAKTMLVVKAKLLVLLGKILDNKYLQNTYSKALEL